MPVEPSEIDEQSILEALAWLMEVIPRDPEFSRLVEEGARGDERFNVSLDGDDLASFCHSIHVLHTYFGFDRSQRWTYWDQTLQNFERPKPKE